MGSGVGAVGYDGADRIGVEEEAQRCGARQDPSSAHSGKDVQTGSTARMRISRDNTVWRGLGGCRNLEAEAP
jgi:hypothetical protein